MHRLQRSFLILLLGLFAPLLLFAFIPGRSKVTAPDSHRASASLFQHLPSHVSMIAPDSSEQEPVEPWLRRVELEEVRQKCQTCHEMSPGGFYKDSTNILNTRTTMSREQWATEIDLTVKCGSCHGVVEPQAVPFDRWMEVLEHMLYVIKVRGAPLDYSSAEWLDVLHYYVTGSTTFEDLPPDPPISGPPFVTKELGLSDVETPKIGNVNIVDLDQDGKKDILVADIDRKGIQWFYQSDTGWVERRLGAATAPAKTEVFDFNKDGHLDIAVAYLGNMLPTDEPIAGAFLLLNDGSMNFVKRPLIDNMGRMADVRPADFDNDGDFDFVLASYGFLTIGEIGWLEQVKHPSGKPDSLSFNYHRLSPKAGGIHVIPTDLNKDGLMDIVGLVAQEYEEVIGFINQGNGEFRQHLIYKAFSPAFGSSGIDIADMDKDGDQDIIYTNGDAVDLPNPMILPYHGVHWLENTGDLEFAYHSIFNFYGAYRAVPGDMDNDGDQDIIAVTMLSNFEDSTRLSAVWLENDGKQNFTPRGIANTPINLITLDADDIDGDGDLDLVTGGMNVFLIIKGRMGRATVWINEGPYGKKPVKKTPKKGAKKKGKR